MAPLVMLVGRVPVGGTQARTGQCGRLYDNVMALGDARTRQWLPAADGLAAWIKLPGIFVCESRPAQASKAVMRFRT